MFLRKLLILFTCLLALTQTISAQDANEDDLKLALQLATLLQSARSVVASEQANINDPAVGDKGLSGDAVLARATQIYLEKTGTDLAAIAPDTDGGKLLLALSDAVRRVMDENAATINKQGVGFKGFVPAVFARLVNEYFSLSAGDIAEIKVTAPPELVRNRKSRPDEWEAHVIQDFLLTSDWVKGQVYSEMADSGGRTAFRALVPEYYGEGCLACHGAPKGEIDITGYPKEGGNLGDLGGVISITLFK